MFRVAVVEPDETVFQWRGTFDSVEDATSKLPAAQAEYPEGAPRVEQLIPVDEDTAEWQTVGDVA